MKYLSYLFLWLSIITSVILSQTNTVTPKVLLSSDDLVNGEHHSLHAETFGKYTSGFNLDVLSGIDKVQSTATEGGGYFIGIKADPPESPVGYNLKLDDNELLNPARKTSYCSGASFAAFVEGLNKLSEEEKINLSADRTEILRMQEQDGGRREDKVKFWGNWNADGFGNHFALTQYFNAGVEINPMEAQPGDFMNISWNSGVGHSVVFLGWYINDQNEKCVVYWSSQKGTNGFGDDVVPVSKIKEVKVVRVIHPEEIFTGTPNDKIDYKITGNKIDW